MIDLGSQARKRLRASKTRPPRAADPTGLAMHSAASADWGTPMLLRRFAACVLRPAAKLGGSIDLDYATSSYWQGWWPDGDCPSTYLDGSPGKDVLVAEDRDVVCPERGSGFLNPPGLNGGAMVQHCWELFERDHREKKLGSGFWEGFSFEQFSSLQGVGARNPLTTSVDTLTTTIVPSRRARYLVHPEQLIAILRKKQARRDRRSKQWFAEQRKIEQLRVRASDAPIPGDAPSHGSFVTILWSHSRVVRRQQMAAARQFLMEQRGDVKSLLYRFEAIGPLDMEARR